MFPWVKLSSSLSTGSFFQFWVSGTLWKTQRCVRQTNVQGGIFVAKMFAVWWAPASSIIGVGLGYRYIVISLRILSESSYWQELRGGILMVEDNKDLKVMGISDSKPRSKWARSHEPCFASRLLSWLSSDSIPPLYNSRMLMNAHTPQSHTVTAYRGHSCGKPECIEFIWQYFR